MFRVEAPPALLTPRVGAAAQGFARRWPRALAAYAVGVVLLGLLGLALSATVGELSDGFGHPEFWLMAGLALLADARAFIALGRHGKPVMICPSLCFTFAILLCWGLGPAILVQAAAAGVVAWRMRYPAGRAAVMAGQFAVATAAAFGVLVVGRPDPFNSIGTVDAVRDAVSVIAAAAVWLIAYQLLRTAAGLASRGRTGVQMLRPAPAYELLSIAALLLLSPLLAVAAHVSAAFVPLVFVPLYAFERMARLSAERDLTARRDPLTDLANRTGLRAAFGRLRRDGRDPAQEPPLAMLLLDLNRFKYVNDALGHEVGDRLLIAVGSRLRAALPPGAVAARLGGDEFAVVAPVSTETEARRLAEAVTEAMATPVVLDGLQVDITGSIGIALSPRDGTDFATVMRHADVAMYLAKQRGWPIQAYRAEDDHNSPERLALLTDFRRALDSGEDAVALHYQPQIDLATGNVVGFEALLRWKHPSQGAIPPADLLRIAEHTPVMRMITQRVIDEVVAQQARWLAAGVSLRTSLNVSIRDLHGDEIITQLTQRLAEHKVPPELIQVEITESALTADLAQLRDTIDKLAAAGVAISLDDFGTGYSSLQHLRRLPLREIKIDRSFVGGIAHNADDAVIVRSTVDLARALGLRVVAEGVENRYTARLLTEAGCDLAQGYLYAPAMPGDSVVAWLDRHPTHA
ncbi:diguanylate cyclase (GGDEF) domain-containing protein [Asanoa hainanensis]|uniref:Diguanylate cyclase (GGDEF) domain-containing protein n=1 Tax=Asanoa hainanensis TaxID=560556 RepID=A0A239GAD5_9ACTN|nr:EAL domain-containing protein [Asanoa hainanensis]SNS65004.1 diguanylate cyclase (GGDEF) domain-containing protein [Asanoa hainanensis]